MVRCSRALSTIARLIAVEHLCGVDSGEDELQREEDGAGGLGWRFGLAGLTLCTRGTRPAGFFAFYPFLLFFYSFLFCLILFWVAFGFCKLCN